MITITRSMILWGLLTTSSLLLAGCSGTSSRSSATANAGVTTAAASLPSAEPYSPESIAAELRLELTEGEGAISARELAHRRADALVAHLLLDDEHFLDALIESFGFDQEYCEGRSDREPRWTCLRPVIEAVILDLERTDPGDLFAAALRARLGSWRERRARLESLREAHEAGGDSAVAAAALMLESIDATAEGFDQAAPAQQLGFVADSLGYAAPEVFHDFSQIPGEQRLARLRQGGVIPDCFASSSCDVETVGVESAAAQAVVAGSPEAFAAVQLLEAFTEARETILSHNTRLALTLRPAVGEPLAESFAPIEFRVPLPARIELEGVSIELPRVDQVEPSGRRPEFYLVLADGALRLGAAPRVAHDGERVRVLGTPLPGRPIGSVEELAREPQRLTQALDAVMSQALPFVRYNWNPERFPEGAPPQIDQEAIEAWISQGEDDDDDEDTQSPSKAAADRFGIAGPSKGPSKAPPTPPSGPDWVARPVAQRLAGHCDGPQPPRTSRLGRFHIALLADRSTSAQQLAVVLEALAAAHHMINLNLVAVGDDGLVRSLDAMAALVPNPCIEADERGRGPLEPSQWVVLDFSATPPRLIAPGGASHPLPVEGAAVAVGSDGFRAMLAEVAQGRGQTFALVPGGELTYQRALEALAPTIEPFSRLLVLVPPGHPVLSAQP